MSKEAMKLALEALKKVDAALRKAWDDRILPASAISYADMNATQDAIKALEEALAKQEKQVVSLQCAHCQVTIETLNDKVMSLLAKQEQGEPVAWNDEQLKMLNFLYGAGDFDGVWFEEKHPTERGAFWWRKHLRRLFETTPQPKQDQLGESVAAEREAIAVWLEKECDEQYLADRIRARWLK